MGATSAPVKPMKTTYTIIASPSAGLSDSWAGVAGTRSNVVGGFRRCA